MFLIVQVLTSSIYCRTGTLVHQVLGLGLIWLSILTNTSDGVKRSGLLCAHACRAQFNMLVAK